MRGVGGVILYAWLATGIRWASATSTTTAIVTATAAPPEAPEPTWGRLYLRHGLAPIQYFRDGFGGPMAPQELTFHVPHRADDVHGCEPLPEDEQAIIIAANGTMALVVDRGSCTFETKSRVAEAMGAAALVIVSADESAKGPIAIVDPGEIAIPSVMIRRSAGELLRAIAETQPLHGRLIPMVCERKPYICKPRRDIERLYVDLQTTRSGTIATVHDNATVGDFLAATYGGVLPLRPVFIAKPMPHVEAHGCMPLDAEMAVAVVGRAVVFDVNRDCSVLQQVSNAQRAGATVVLLAMSETGGIVHPSVTESWHAYNITIVAATISSPTALKLRELAVQTTDVAIEMRSQNDIAKAWEEIRRLSVPSAWPKRRKRKEILVRRLLSSLSLDAAQLSALEHNYVDVAGGSISSWNAVVKPNEVAVEHTGYREDL